jgi:hypothetical protein
MAKAVRYRAAGSADIGEASWIELAQLIMAGQLAATAEVWTHEDAAAGGGAEEAESSLCTVVDIIDVGEVIDADADEADEIADALQEGFEAHVAARALDAAPEPEPELAEGLPSPFDNLSKKERGAFEAAKAQLPGVDERDVLAYCKTRGFNADKAVAQCQATQQWQATRKAVTIADIAPFMRTPPGAAGPDGCMFVLEDGRGDCARDIWGRPVVVSYGMLHGTAEEQQMQMTYAIERAQALSRPGTMGSTTVIEVPPSPRHPPSPPGRLSAPLVARLLGRADGLTVSRCWRCGGHGCAPNLLQVVPKEGAAVTFRFPDAAVCTATLPIAWQLCPVPDARCLMPYAPQVRTVFDLQKAHFPRSLSSTNHFVGKLWKVSRHHQPCGAAGHSRRYCCPAFASGRQLAPPTSKSGLYRSETILVRPYLPA